QLVAPVLAVGADHPLPGHREMVWVLATKLASATAVSTMSAEGGQLADKQMSDCQALGRALGVTVPPLFARVGNRATDSAAGMHFLMSTAIPGLSGELRVNGKPGDDTLVALGLRTGLPLIIYGVEEREMAQSMAKYFTENAAKVGLSAEVRPLAEAL